MPDHRYEVNEFYLPKTNTIAAAKERLDFIRAAIPLLDDDRHWSASRMIAAMGFYNSFYSVFEIIKQAKRRSSDRLAYDKWKEENAEEYQEFDSLYHAFRNLMTHQGAYIPSSIIVWEDDIINDTVFPVSTFPKFMSKISVNNRVLAEYTLKEWAEYCVDRIGAALFQIEQIAASIRNKPT